MEKVYHDEQNHHYRRRQRRLHHRIYLGCQRGIASEVVLIDVNTQKALGEAMDIRQATPFTSQTQIYAGSYADAENSNIVIVTSGIARKPGQSRIDLTQTNVDIIKSIVPQVVKHAPNAIYILVSNPVDILTYVFAKVSGLPSNHIMGSGTILDTARLRTRLAEYFSISQKNVHAYVLGEHGDSSFIPWSMATSPASCWRTTATAQPDHGASAGSRL